MAKSPDKSLLTLVRKGPFEGVEDIIYLLDQGADPFDRIDMFAPAVFYCLKHNDFKTLDVFISHPAVDFDYGYCFYHSIAEKNQALTDFLISRVEQKGGFTKHVPAALEDAYTAKDFSLFCRLLDLHKTPDIYFNKQLLSRSALDWADQRYFEYFITSGVNVSLPLTRDQQDFRKDTSLLEELAECAHYHKQLAFVLEHSKIPFAVLEKAWQRALKGAAENANLLKNVMEKDRWQFDPECPSRITCYTFNYTPEYSLIEIFNFKSNAGERVSVLRNIQTRQESMTRESFSMIDDPDVILQAARELEKVGGKPEEGQIFSPVLKTKTIIPRQ